MNLYIRFFNDETLVTNVDDAVDFLRRVTNDELDPALYDQLNDYHNSPVPYPRRFKVRARIYFIVIKTPAATMEEFKARGAQMQASGKNAKVQGDDDAMAEDYQMDAVPGMPGEGIVKSKSQYDNYEPGWYDVEMTFKRVVFNEARGKNEYIDTDFAARVKAHSAKESYDKVCSYLMGRDDVDSRSQMPSIKGRNVSFRYLGM